MSRDPLKPGGALEGRLFKGFLKRLSETREPEPGERIGPWRVVEELGRGGSGVVFLAERADGAFSQQVALKWLRGDRPVPGGRAVLARERELLASLDHPHIARLIDGGETDDGMLWFAMDYAAGQTIDLHSAGLPLAERVELVQTVCRAVHHAHRRGLIHGDIKPSNILVDARGQPRLVDFGISRLKGKAIGASYGLTPDYASPEQRRGDELTTASDIWQLGHLLEDLIGDEPVSADLRAVVAQATCQRPEDRYASVSAMAADLDAWRAHFPVAAYGGGPGYRLRRLVRRNIAVSAVAAAALLIIVVGGVWMTWQLAAERDIARAEAARAETALAHAEAELVRAESLREFLISLFRATRPDRPADELPTTDELLAAGARRAMDDQAVPDADQFGMLVTIADVYLNLGELERAEPLIEEAVALARQNADERPEDLARALIMKGTSILYPGPDRADEAAALFAEAERVADGHYRAHDAWVHARTRRAWLRYRLADAPGALELLRPLSGKAFDPDDSGLADSTRLRLLNTLGSVHGRLGQHEQALLYDLEAVELSARVNGVESRGHAVERANLGSLQLRLGDFGPARDNLLTALELYDRIYENRPVPYRAAALGSLANYYLFTGDYERALEHTHASLAEWAAVWEVEPEDYDWHDYHLGLQLLRMQRFEAARDHLQQSIESFSEPTSPTSGAVMSRARLALVQCRLGDAENGRELLASLDEWPEPDSAGHQAELLEARASCLHASGSHREALATVGASLEQVDWPGQALHRAQRHQLRAEILQALGRPEEAADTLERARQLLLDAGLDEHPALDGLSE